MFVTMNLYQNGDITIVQKSDKWDSFENEILSTNFFKVIKDQDSCEVVDLFNQYKDILTKYNQLKCIAGRREHVSEQESRELLKAFGFDKGARGELLESIVLLNIESFGGLDSSTSLKKERKVLENNLAEITKKLLTDAKAFQKEALKKQEETLQKVTKELSGVNLDG